MRSSDRALVALALALWGALGGCTLVSRAPVLPLTAPAPEGPSSPGPLASGAPSSAPEVWAPPPPSSLTPLAGPFVSTGHGGGAFSMRVLSSDPLAYERPASPGLVLCAEQRTAAEGAPAPLACMRRGPEGWRYGVVLPGGNTWAREGDLDDCASCHRAAPRQGLFGPP